MIEENLCATGMRSLLLCWRCRPLIDLWLSACQTPVLILILQNKRNKSRQKKKPKHYPTVLSHTHTTNAHILCFQKYHRKKPTKFYQVIITNVIFVWLKNKNISTQLLYKSSTFISRKDICNLQTILRAVGCFFPWYASGIFYPDVIM